MDALSRHLSGIFSVPSANVTFFSVPILNPLSQKVRDFGRLTSVRDALSKAAKQISSSPSGKLISVRPLHPLNAYWRIDLRESGRTTFVISFLFSNTRSPISVTGILSISAGIVTSVSVPLYFVIVISSLSSTFLIA